MTMFLRLACAAVALAALPFAAHAQPVDQYAPRLHPSNGASVVDTFHAVFVSYCGYPVLDPRRAPEIVRTPPQSTTNTVEEISITYFVQRTICPGLPPPRSDGTTTFEIGQLQEGTTAVLHKYIELGPDGAPAGFTQTFVEWVAVGDTPNVAVSGTWFDPATAGTGVSLSLAPNASDEPTAIVFLATLDDAGAPVWFSGAGMFEDAVLTVPLTRSTASGTGPIATQPAGTARFEYLGCGRARFAFDGAGVRFPGEAGVDLQQLTNTAGVPSCEPPPTDAAIIR